MFPYACQATLNSMSLSKYQIYLVARKRQLSLILLDEVRQNICAKYEAYQTGQRLQPRRAWRTVRPHAELYR